MRRDSRRHRGGIPSARLPPCAFRCVGRLFFSFRWAPASAGFSRTFRRAPEPSSLRPSSSSRRCLSCSLVSWFLILPFFSHARTHVRLHVLSASPSHPVVSSFDLVHVYVSLLPTHLFWRLRRARARPSSACFSFRSWCFAVLRASPAIRHAPGCRARRSRAPSPRTDPTRAMRRVGSVHTTRVEPSSWIVPPTGGDRERERDRPLRGREDGGEEEGRKRGEGGGGGGLAQRKEGGFLIRRYPMAMDTIAWPKEVDFCILSTTTWHVPRHGPRTWRVERNRKDGNTDGWETWKGSKEKRHQSRKIGKVDGKRIDECRKRPRNPHPCKLGSHAVEDPRSTLQSQPARENHHLSWCKSHPSCAVNNAGIIWQSLASTQNCMDRARPILPLFRNQTSSGSHARSSASDPACN